MFTSTVILAGTVVVEGKPFRWWVTDSLSQRLTVGHSIYGTETERLVRSPATQARSIGRALLTKRAASIVEPLEDAEDGAAPEDGEIPGPDH